MEIRKCTEISKKALHQLFLEGYKDYIVDVSMDYETFYEKFINYYAIDLGHSFVAIVKDQPVGFILGSINNYENIKTLRCASFAVIKEYRDKNIGSRLLEKHIKTGIDNNCERLFLEVIKENKAKFFYLKNGYEIIDKLFYYTLALKSQEIEQEGTINFVPMSNNEMNRYLIEKNVHINYQNHPVVLKNSKANKYYKLEYEGETIGVISFNTSGTISILELKVEYKQKEYLNNILHYLKNNEAIENVRICVTTEMNYVSLFKSVGFRKNELEQFEMVKQL